MSRNKKILNLAAASLLAAAAIPSTAFASNGVLDFIDPCIEAHDQFNDQRDGILRELNQKIADADTAKSNDEYRKLWIESKKKALRAVFDQNEKPVPDAAGVKDPQAVEAAYAKWFEGVLGQLTPEQLSSLQDSNFRFELKEYLTAQRQKGSAELEAEKAKLSSACKMDVGNQALRVALIGALKPLTFVAGNWKAAEKDGVVAQVIAAPTGINPVDAVRCPVRGCSDKSVVNQALKVLGF
jgi:hypothetical protein